MCDEAIISLDPFLRTSTAREFYIGPFFVIFIELGVRIRREEGKWFN
jgi:hypothetical protein